MFLLIVLASLSSAVYTEAAGAFDVHLRHRAGHPAAQDYNDLQSLYIWTLKYSLTGVLLETPYYPPHVGITDPKNMKPYDSDLRVKGEDWPAYGLTMVGVTGLHNIETLVTQLINNKVPGDLMECGVWRGGSSLFMRGLLKAHAVSDRKVHLVDSFEGLPAASTSNDNSQWKEMEYVKVSQDEVQAAFKRHNLLDSQVQFHKGFFRESLPVFRKNFRDTKIALLRMDGDMYESTVDVLYNLADFLSPGACIIVDDYSIPECRRAITEFLTLHKLSPTIVPVNAEAAYFCLDKKVELQRSWYDEFNSGRKPLA